MRIASRATSTATRRRSTRPRGGVKAGCDLVLHTGGLHATARAPTGRSTGSVRGFVCVRGHFDEEVAWAGPAAGTAGRGARRARSMELTADRAHQRQFSRTSLLPREERGGGGLPASPSISIRGSRGRRRVQLAGWRGDRRGRPPLRTRTSPSIGPWAGPLHQRRSVGRQDGDPAPAWRS
jgi:hypothetical protein